MPSTMSRPEGRRSKMSEKNAKQERKLKLVTEEAELEQTAKEQAKSISKMYEDRDKKALAAKEHMINQLSVTSEKYRTANGVMSALETVRTVLGGAGPNIYPEIDMAQRIAKDMSVIAEKMAIKAGELDPEDMCHLCDKFYDADIVSKSLSMEDLAKQLMILQLCQNVGPSAEDMTDFCRTADDEIEKARQNLRTFCTENNINFNELCGPHDNCPDCLCMSCQNECKDHRYIEEGQSAYDVCEKFVEQE